MATVIKTWGYKRRNQVPDIEGTTPKVCPKCKLWFAAPPRFRVCPNDQPRHLLAKRADQAKHLTNLTGHTTGQTGQFVRQTRSSRGRVLLGSALGSGLAVIAAREDQENGISFGCKYPKERQADHLPSARRHPFAGDRPEESGYCDVACNCKCHTSAYSAAQTLSGAAA